MLKVTPDLRELVGSRVMDLASGETIDAGYTIDGMLGMGGMGVAFLAHVSADAKVERPGRPAPGTRLVLKILLPEIVLREAKVAQLSFKKEVVALARLSERRPPSPFVVRWLDAGLLPVSWEPAREQGIDPLLLPWSAMELVDGRPLGTTLEERLEHASGPIEPVRAASLIDGIVRGVRAIHAVGLVHRDLKPSNVLVCGEPPYELPKITDFGVARASGIGDTFDVTVGTTGYCALEQLEGRSATGKDAVGPWSDVFAIGAIAYEILSRAPMYADAPTAMGYVGRVLARNFVRLSDYALGPAWETAEGRAVAAEWDRLLLRATSPRSPGGGSIGNDVGMPMRHRDVDELLDELEPLLEKTRGLSRRRTIESVARDDGRTRRWEWSVSPPAPAPLVAAAVRNDGIALAATATNLLHFDGERWTELPARKYDDGTVAVLQGGAGTFVVVRADGEVEVLPGGGGAFSFRLPFAVKRATALAGHPLGTAWLAVLASHGEWTVLRLRGRAASPFTRLGKARIHAMAAGVLGDEEVLVVAGSTEGRRDEAFVSAIDHHGRAFALPPIPGPSVDTLAFEEDDLLLAGPEGVGRIDGLRRVVLLDPAPTSPVASIAALPDGQVWGFAAGTVQRRVSGAWLQMHVDPSLASRRLLATAASGARVWAVYDDGRIVLGRLALSTG
ncbi:MAG: protein kinase domain-containing protein [Polyangiales bacterium]